MNNENAPKTKLQVLRQTFISSAIISVAAAFSAAGFSRTVMGHVELQFLLNAILLAGALVVSAGLGMLFLPAKIKGEGPIDHTNYAELKMKAREEKRVFSFEILYVGFGVFAIAGITEVLIALIQS